MHSHQWEPEETFKLVFKISETVLQTRVRSMFAFLSARKADLKKGFQHLVVLVVVLIVVVVGTRVKKRF
jgi:hypothetical protein